MPCDLLMPPKAREWRSKILCHQNFPSLPLVAACGGDSGGPMVVCEGDRIVLIGISSFGWHPDPDHSNDHRCDTEKGVSAYTDIQAHLSWIKEKIGEGNNKSMSF